MTRHTPLPVIIEFFCIGLLVIFCAIWSANFWYIGMPFDGGPLGAPDTVPVWFKVVFVITPGLLGLTMLYLGIHNLRLRWRNVQQTA